MITVVSTVLFFLGLAACFLYTAVLLFYRIWVHPLAKYPGPWFAKFTNLYSGYHAWKGDLHIDMWRCHERYGDFVRYGPNSLLVNTAKGLHDVYSHGKSFKKAQRYQAMVHRAPNTLTVIDKAKHGKKRRIISQGFSDAALKGHEPIILEQVQRLRSQLETDDSGRALQAGSWSCPKNMARFCDYFTFDVMCNIIFDIPWSTLRDPTWRFVPEVIEQSNVRVGTLSQAPELTLLRLDKLLFPEAIKARDRFITFIDKILGEGIKAAAASGKGVFATLANAKDPETQQPLRMRELGGESATLIVAGTDTTSTALAGCLFYLAHNRSAYERVVAEVRGAFRSREEIKMGSQMHQCLFLRACIDESMRMSPPAASSLWRETEEDGAIVNGEHIPAGVDVGTCIYSIHHNSVYYPEPFSFRPERWIHNEAHIVKGDVAAARSAFNPFSIGPRSCIGKGLAYVELQLALANILWSFDFRLAVGDLGMIGEGREGAEFGRHRVDEFQLEDHLTAAKHGPFVEFRAR